MKGGTAVLVIFVFLLIVGAVIGIFMWQQRKKKELEAEKKIGAKSYWWLKTATEEDIKKELEKL